MDTIEILRTASKLVYENVKDLAGTKEATSGNFGIGAGGDISQNIDIIAEKTVLDYLKKINPEIEVLKNEFDLFKNTIKDSDNNYFIDIGLKKNLQLVLLKKFDEFSSKVNNIIWVLNVG